MANVDDYLNSVLENRDKELGLGGNYSFEVYTVGKNNLLIFKIENLTQKKAQDLFDLFDENNQLPVNRLRERSEYLKIAISQKGKEVDFNILPNIHTISLD